MMILSRMNAEEKNDTNARTNAGITGIMIEMVRR